MADRNAASLYGVSARRIMISFRRSTLSGVAKVSASRSNDFACVSGRFPSRCQMTKHSHFLPSGAGADDLLAPGASTGSYQAARVTRIGMAALIALDGRRARQPAEPPQGASARPQRGQTFADVRGDLDTTLG